MSLASGSAQASQDLAESHSQDCRYSPSLLAELGLGGECFSALARSAYGLLGGLLSHPLILHLLL